MTKPFQIVTRARRTATAKRDLSRSFMGRDHKHVANALPADPTPDEVDACVLKMEGWERFTWTRCGACDAWSENGVAFRTSPYGGTICESCVRSAYARLEKVLAEEAKT
jgi:hypothetical protein